MKDATLKQAGKALEVIGQKEIPGEQLQELIGSGLLSDLLDADIGAIDRNEFRKICGLKPKNIFSVSVNYDRSVEDGIKAGEYVWVNDDITQEHFPTKRSGTAEIDVELVYFGDDVGVDEAFAGLDRKGLRPAELHELLALGEKFPDLQSKFPIIALGSVLQSPTGGRGCPCLDRGGSGRGLNVGWLGGWFGSCRFAAVRK